MTSERFIRQARALRTSFGESTELQAVQPQATFRK